MLAGGDGVGLFFLRFFWGGGGRVVADLVLRLLGLVKFGRWRGFLFFNGFMMG
jgi:hypothetical protein